MASILIIPLPELGHILPTLPLVRRLAARGHEIVYLTAPQFAPEIEWIGATIEPLICQEPGCKRLSGPGIWYQLASSHEGQTRSQILCDIVTSLLNRRHITLALCDRILAVKDRGELLATLGKARTASFSTSLTNWDDRLPGDLDCPTLTFCPQTFEVPQYRSQDRNSLYVEPSLKPLELEDSLEDVPLQDGKPLVVASFGTQSVRYRELQSIVKAISVIAQRNPGLQFAVSIGVGVDHVLSSCVEAPTNIVIRRQLPQRRLLGKTSALITHGGLGTIKEAICAGVPLVAIPMSHDQPFNAMRLRYHGLGEGVFRENRTTDGLEEALRRALDGKYAKRMSQMQRKFLELEGMQKSYSVTERWLSDGQVAMP
jgi:UDP:flavonoid glycosyltransferase YjiC (YdhE family)